MKYNGLRRAWSVTFGIVCVLLVVMWVRSYSLHERARTDRLRFAECWIESFRGEFGVSVLSPCRNLWNGWDFLSHPVDDVRGFPVTMDGVQPLPKFFGFRNLTGPTSVILFVPCWAPVILFGALAGSVWLQPHFKLRTLLIAVAVVAVGLGVISAL